MKGAFKIYGLQSCAELDNITLIFPFLSFFSDAFQLTISES